MFRSSLIIACFYLVTLVSCENEPVGGDDHASVSFLITLQPGSEDGKDAFIEDYPYGDYRNKNWGNSEEFAAISWTAGGVPFVVRSVIDFDFDTIPANAIIDSARLSLFAYGNEYHGYGHDTLTGSNESYLLRVVSEWHEDSVTWNKQPQISELNRVFLPGSNHPMEDYIGIDITALVRDIYNNPEESFGFMLRLKDEEGYRRMFFATSDVNERNMRPKLDIFYSLNTD